MKFESISRISLEKIPKQFLVLSSRRSEFKITCVLCSVLNLRLKKVHSSSNKNLSYKKVKVEINQLEVDSLQTSETQKSIRYTT